MGEVPWDSSSPTPNSSTDKPRGRGLESSLLSFLLSLLSFFLSVGLSDTVWQIDSLDHIHSLLCFCLFSLCFELARLCCACPGSFDGPVSILAKISHFLSLLPFLEGPLFTAPFLTCSLFFLLQKDHKNLLNKAVYWRMPAANIFKPVWVILYEVTIMHYL